jgi:hypothetical protein
VDGEVCVDLYIQSLYHMIVVATSSHFDSPGVSLSCRLVYSPPAERLQPFHVFVNSETTSPGAKHEVLSHRDAVIEPGIENACGFKAE